jgi:hypothetical protein
MMMMMSKKSLKYLGSIRAVWELDELEDHRSVTGWLLGWENVFKIYYAIVVNKCK